MSGYISEQARGHLFQVLQLMSPAGIDSINKELSNVMEVDLKYHEYCVDVALA